MNVQKTRARAKPQSVVCETAWLKTTTTSTTATQTTFDGENCAVRQFPSFFLETSESEWFFLLFCSGVWSGCVCVSVPAVSAHMRCVRAEDYCVERVSYGQCKRADGRKRHARYNGLKTPKNYIARVALKCALCDLPHRVKTSSSGCFFFFFSASTLAAHSNSKGANNITHTNQHTKKQRPHPDASSWNRL